MVDRLDWKVATVDEEGLRGTVAARDFMEGDIVAAVPYNCSVELVPGKSSVTGAEAAIQLLRKRFEDPTWWSHMQPHWESLPERSQVYNRHTFLQLLQDANMVASVKAVLKNVDNVYSGASTVGPSRRYTSLAHLPGSADVTKEEFAYFAALMDSYTFSFPSHDEEEGESPRVQMVPVLDLMNHADEPNVVLSRHQ
ncbi:g8704 [Coccomyxa elongata]